MKSLATFGWLLLAIAIVLVWATVNERIGYDRGYSQGQSILWQLVDDLREENAALKKGPWREGFQFGKQHCFDQFKPANDPQLANLPPFVDTPGTTTRDGYAWQWQVNPEGELLYRRLDKVSITRTDAGYEIGIPSKSLGTVPPVEQ